MLSGVSPFRRGTAAETMTAILRDDAPELPEPVACSPTFRRLVARCLEKAPADRFQNARDLAFALESAGATATGAVPLAGVAPRRRFARHASVAAALGLTAAAAFLIGRGTAAPPARADVAGVHRLTDLPGLEEFPAIAPDSKAVAFVARAGGFRQIFVRLMAGGPPLQVTRDAADHDVPRWTPDSSSLVYFSPAVPGDTQGTLWEIPALGGAPRRLMASVGGGDVGRDGGLAAFRLADGAIELITASRDGAEVRVVARFSEPAYYKYPHWSPDGNWIAYQRGDGVRWDVFAAPVSGGNPRQLTHDNTQIHGLSWLPDSSGIVYSSSRGASMPYLPTQGLWEARLAGGAPRRLVLSDLSHLHPDTHGTSALVASRLSVTFDLWSFPTDGSALENVRRARRLTHQTGQVQTPTIGASDREIAFLSDGGGHANLWITTPATSQLRQLTYERDPDVALGVPIWSPDGKWISFVSSRGNSGLGFGVWVVQPDGGNLRQVVDRGLGGAWSPDSQFIYYIDGGVAYKVALGGGAPARVRAGPVRNMIGFAGDTMYFMVDRTLADGSSGFEIHAASPEDGPSRVIARILSSRVPQWQIINPSLSPDGAWLAMPLTDGVTTNIWTLSTSSGEWRQVTDFGDRPTFIARRVAWSTDGRSIVAAVGDGDADIVVFEPERPAAR
jgi:Tol biopolymer transport system component